MISDRRSRTWRTKQFEFNRVHNITPTTIFKTVDEVQAATAVADVRSRRDARQSRGAVPAISQTVVKYLSNDQRHDLLEELRSEMRKAAKDLDFERAASAR